MDTSLLLEWIRACIDEGKFYVEAHAVESHPLQEGFRLSQAMESISRGTIVSHREQDAVCIVCGDVPTLSPRAGFHGNFIHTVISYDRTTQIIIITMYRPRLDEWETPTRRRRRP